MREAHASDAWQVKENAAENIHVKTPRTLKERSLVAETCTLKLALEIPILVDAFDNAVEKRYYGWPDRLYVIDCDGQVAYRSRPGPFGFKPREAEDALRKILK